MKVACLIKDAPPLIHFVNRVHQTHGVDLVVLEQNSRLSSRLSRRYRRGGLPAVAGAVAERMSAGRAERSSTQARADAMTRWFGGNHERLSPDIRIVEVPSINSDQAVGALRQLGPDVLLDHGTSIVDDRVIKLADVALNLHWGISPYYRGVRCTEWALIFRDPYNIGATVHTLTPEIDGGAIIGQARAEVAAGDTAFSINMQLTALGTEVVCEGLGIAAANGRLEGAPQKSTEGFLFSSQHWSTHLQRQINAIERRGEIARMLDRPARELRLPLIELS